MRKAGSRVGPAVHYDDGGREPAPGSALRKPRTGGSPIRSNLVALGVVWMLVLGYLAPLFGGAIPWNQDVALYFLPFKIVGAELYRHGHLPFWTPLAGLGYPILADGQAALLYLPDVALFLLLPPPTALAASVVGHALLGSALAYAFFRRRVLAPPAAALGSLIFSFAGPLLPLAGTPRLSTAAWWPAILLAVDATLRPVGPTGRSSPGDAGGRSRPPSRWLAIGAIAVAASLLAGFPQVAVEGLFLAAAYALFLAWWGFRHEVAASASRIRLKRLGWAIAMLGLGGGLAAPQWLATLELAGQSARASGAGALAGQGSLFPPGLVELVAPNWAFAATLGDESPAAFVGVLALALAGLAIGMPARGLDRRPGEAWFWGGVVVVSVALAFGRFTPLFLVISHLPGLSYFRVPARFLYLTTTALAALAALGLDGLLEWSRARRPDPASSTPQPGALSLAAEPSEQDASGRPVRALVRVGLLLGGIALAVDVGLALALRLLGDRLYAVVARSANVATLTGQPATSRLVAGALAATALTNSRLWAPLPGLLGVLLVAVALRRSAGQTRLLRAPGWLAFASAAAELILLGFPLGGVQRPIPPATVAAVRAALEVDGGASPGQASPTSRSGRIYSFAEPFRAASDGRYDLLPANLPAADGIATIGLYAALGDPEYATLLAPLGAVNLAFGAPQPSLDALATHRRLLDLLGASLIVSPIPLDPRPNRDCPPGISSAGLPPAQPAACDLELVDQVGGVFLYRNSTAFPRGWVVDQVRSASGPAGISLRAALEARSGGYPLDLRHVAFLDSGLSSLDREASQSSVDPLALAAPLAVGSGPGEEATLLRDDGDRVVVRASGPGLLVLADRWAPGWEVTIDSAPAPLERVDGVLRGVLLPPGPHGVTFTYRPPGFWRGGAIALGSIVALVGLTLGRRLAEQVA